jgi:hypothetical protein
MRYLRPVVKVLLRRETREGAADDGLDGDVLVRGGDKDVEAGAGGRWEAGVAVDAGDLRVRKVRARARLSVADGPICVVREVVEVSAVLPPASLRHQSVAPWPKGRDVMGLFFRGQTRDAWWAEGGSKKSAYRRCRSKQREDNDPPERHSQNNATKFLMYYLLILRYGDTELDSRTKQQTHERVEKLRAMSWWL